MKSIRLLPLVGLFMLCLFFGFRAGRSLAPSFSEGAAPQQRSANIQTRDYPVPDAQSEAELATVLPSAPNPEASIHEENTETIRFTRPSGNGQLNLLVVVVDQLGATTPKLESLWLIVFSPDMPHFMFLPIYPTIQAGAGDKSSGGSLAEVDGLLSNTRPGAHLTSRLELRGIWWDVFILMDETGVVDLVNLFSTRALLDSESPVDAQPNAEEPQVTTPLDRDWNFFLQSMPSSEENPEAAQWAQYRLIQEVCLRSTVASPLEIAQGAFQVIRTNPNHIQTDLSLNQVVALWRGHQESRTGFSCEFPSLAAIPAQ
jgi:hypothetical protein